MGTRERTHTVSIGLYSPRELKGHRLRVTFWPESLLKFEIVNENDNRTFGLRAAGQINMKEE